MTLSTTQTRPISRQRPFRKTLSSVLKYSILCAVAAVFLLPFYWLLNTSLKVENQVFAYPPVWFPDPIRLQNYLDVLTSPAFPFVRLLRNTIFYAGTGTLGMLLSCSAVAYGFARLRFRGRDFLFGITLSTMMLPGIVRLIPTYLLFRRFGWVGSYAPLLIPQFFGNAFNIFLLRQFFINLPWELSDAARVDGASEFRTFWQVMLPMVKPALLVAGVFHFMWLWNDFMGPLIYLSDSRQYPLVLGLSAFRSRFEVQWHLMMAASLLTSAPLVVIFFVAQRHLIEGVALTGLKG
jgi:ABC-type glycerol-3-phosphate transport system permease component